MNSARPKAHRTVGLHNWVRKMRFFLLADGVCHKRGRDGTGKLEVSRESGAVGRRMSI